MSELPLIIEPDQDDPDCAAIMVDGTIAGRPYRFTLDTGAALSQVEADEYTAALDPVGSHEQPMDLILGYPTLRQADWLFDFPSKRWTLAAAR